MWEDFINNYTMMDQEDILHPIRHKICWRGDAIKQVLRNRSTSLLSNVEYDIWLKNRVKTLDCAHHYLYQRIPTNIMLNLIYG